MNHELASGAPEIAGFWRRLGAFIIDALLLGVGGAITGSVLFDTLASMGPWGRLVGFCVGLLYFGILNSRLADGQTVGKRLLKIKVVGADGRALPLSRSLLRFSILGVPWFLNGAGLPMQVLLSPTIYLVALLVFGGGLAILYLLIFNRGTRQSLHDLAVHSYVVRAESSGAVSTTPLWPVHAVVVVLLFLLAAAVPYFTNRLGKTEFFGGLQRAAQAVNAAPEVRYVNLNQGTNYSSQGQSTYFQITAFLWKAQVTDAALAKRLAKAALTADPAAMKVDSVQVVLVYGYDIGIANANRKQIYNESAANWVK